MSATTTSIETLAINTIRTLSMDAVQQANSGHPGTPMALAPVAYTLFNEVMRYDPAAPHWPGRDRFILSCGHASMLLYSVLHLTGVKAVDKKGNVLEEASITLENLRDFRQWGSPCAGHPEYGEAAGIETTTGPLGQGIGNSVGMAIAGRWLADRYNKPDCELFPFNVYALCSDGDLMEGVGCEAASLAGHLGLGNLCWIYDSNRITIEGSTDLAFSEDVPAKFEAMGWNTVTVEDANDLSALRGAIASFQETSDRPTLIMVQSIIGYGAPTKAGDAEAHGAPLGPEEIKGAKKAYGWPEKDFYVPPEVREHFAAGVGARGSEQREAWEATFKQYQEKYPDQAAELKTLWSGELPKNWDADIPTFPADAKGMATRASSGKVLNAVAKNIPWMLGGSADLAPSTKTLLEFSGAGNQQASSHGGRNMHFGIREHAMASACNGMALASLRPYGATFFVFTDYMRPAMRLAAIMHQPVLYVLTHDSIGLGEDGPTHQPIEHLAACRAIPRLLVMRPGDANEVAEAYRIVVAQTNRPSALILSRQNVPTLDREKFASAAGVARGGYVLADAKSGTPEVILIGTGSELSLCVEAYEALAQEGIAVRLVSMPCFELFDEQDEAYRHSVLPPAVTSRVAVEAGIKQGWERYLGDKGLFIGLDNFGASAPYETLYEKFGLTSAAVAAAGKKLAGK